MSYKLGRLAMVFSALLLLLASCNQAEPPPLANATATLAVAPTTLDSPLPAPTATLSALDSPLPLSMRSPTSTDKAAVKGNLVLMNPEFVAPREDGLYLVLVDPNSQMAMPSVGVDMSIQAEVDEVTGDFFFDDVDEGLYAFVVLTDSGQQLSVREMDTGKASIVTVGEADLNTTIDLGMLRLP